MQKYQINSQKTTWIAIGVMSGTSVDGLDLAAVKFQFNGGKWSYEIKKTASIDYPGDLRNRLINCIQINGEELVSLDLELGRFIGKNVKEFLKHEFMQVDLIASHGHTVFHQPERRLTRQIGDGQSILSECGILTVNDFRTMDILKGGQGAPLVPLGDHFLFPDYDVCLNIGGFANISYVDKNGSRMALDTGPANILLNHLTRKLGYSYDQDGDIARKGKNIMHLYNELNTLSYYQLPPPKSLGLEWVKENIYPMIDGSKHTIEDLLHTCVLHIAHQINQSIEKACEKNRLQIKGTKVLMTGGGVHNRFLVEVLQQESKYLDYIIPSTEVINFKEAIIFAFLGVLRLKQQINIFNSVTGASSDSIGGTVHDNI